MLPSTTIILSLHCHFTFFIPRLVHTFFIFYFFELIFFHSNYFFFTWQARAHKFFIYYFICIHLRRSFIYDFSTYSPHNSHGVSIIFLTFPTDHVGREKCPHLHKTPRVGSNMCRPKRSHWTSDNLLEDVYWRDRECLCTVRKTKGLRVDSYISLHHNPFTLMSHKHTCCK